MIIDKSPILANKSYNQPSVFTPVTLLREARRQKGLSAGSVPEVCILDPDGDFLRYVRNSGAGIRDPHRTCYHTDLYNFYIAHVTNQMGTIENDFEKGLEDGNAGLIGLVSRVVRRWRCSDCQKVEKKEGI